MDELRDCMSFVSAVIQYCVLGLPFGCPQDNGREMLCGRFISSQDFTEQGTLDVRINSSKEYLRQGCFTLKIIPSIATGATAITYEVDAALASTVNMYLETYPFLLQSSTSGLVLRLEVDAAMT